MLKVLDKEYREADVERLAVWCAENGYSITHMYLAAAYRVGLEKPHIIKGKDYRHLSHEEAMRKAEKDVQVQYGGWEKVGSEFCLNYMPMFDS